MIELVHDNVGERRETGLAARDRLHRRRCLHNLLARAAGVVGTHGANDPPLHRRNIEHLVTGLSQRTQHAAAIGTGAVARLRFDPAFDAWQMVRQAAYRCGANGLNIIRLVRCIFAGADNLGFAFQFLECQLKLSDLGNQLLRGLPETHPLELGKLETQRLDQGVAGRQSSFQLGDPGVFVDEGNGLIRHPDPLANQDVQCQKNLSKPVTFYPARRGITVRSGRRQSMPSSSIESCADVRLTLPVFVTGHTNLPRSIRLENRHMPWPSYHSSLTRSPRLPRKANSAPQCGFLCNTCCASTARPPAPLRMSVAPQAR